ncbi:MAG: aldehyde dehydrogenase family protein [Rhizobiaceae bacterium]
MAPERGEAPNATLADLDAAVAAAKKAFESWSQRPDDELREACEAVAATIGKRSEELARKSSPPIFPWKNA